MLHLQGINKNKPTLIQREMFYENNFLVKALTSTSAGYLFEIIRAFTALA